MQGRSIQTANDWLQAFRQFVRWLVANQRLGHDPLTRLMPGNVRFDVRHRRGELTVNEVAKLLIVTKEQKPFRRIDGPNRVMIYSIALGTSFRLSELANLTPKHFNLDTSPPVIVLHAGDSKNRQSATQLIAQWLADELRTFLNGREPNTRLWPGSWCDRGADMLRRDLEAANIAREVDSADGVEVRDFHSLRNTYISGVIRSGADLKQAMTLARHSDPRLTTARYARTNLQDLGTVVESLPGGEKWVAEWVADDEETEGSLSAIENIDGSNSEGNKALEMRKPLGNKVFEDDQGRLETERAGFEPAVQFYPHAALAKRCFRPLSHLS